MKQRLSFLRLLSLLLILGAAKMAVYATVTINYSPGDAQGLSPKTEYVNEGSTYTVKKNFTFYKDGMTLTSWYDTNSGATYTPGQTIKVNANLNLTPRFSTNSVSLADRKEEVRVRFVFSPKDGAPKVNWANTDKAIWVTQVMINGKEIDVPAYINTSSLHTEDGTEWCLINTGTQINVPSCLGATLSMNVGGQTTSDESIFEDYGYAYSLKTEMAYRGIGQSSDRYSFKTEYGYYYKYIEMRLPSSQSLPKAAPLPAATETLMEKYDTYVDGIYFNVIKKAKRATVMHVGGEEKTFYGNVVIPETIEFEGTTCNVVEISQGAFAGCIYLSSLTIPKSIEKIGYYAGWGGSDCKITNLYVPNLNYWCTALEFEKGNPISHATVFYADNKAISDLTIPSGVPEVKPGLFKEYTGLKSVTIPSGVKTIGSGAFDTCEYLEAVTISSTVDSIANHAFEDCSSLTRVNITDMSAWCSMKFAGSGGSSAPISSRDPFTRAPKRASSNETPSYDGANPLENTSASLYLNGTEITNLVVPNGVKTINGLTFAKYTKLRSVTLPNSVDSIGKAAFACCEALTEVKLNNGLRVIGGEQLGYKYGAFYHCTNLKSVSLPNTLKTIGGSAFDGCTSMTSLTIPNSVTTLGSSAFQGCTGLTSLTIPASINFVVERNRVGSGYDAFSGCTGLTTVTFADGVKGIPNRGFFGCTALKSVTIPNSVTAIGGSAFQGCSSLTSITIPNSMRIINADAFLGCSSLTTVVLGNGLEEVWDAAFTNCKELTDVYCYCSTVPAICVSSLGYYGYTYPFDNSEVEYATLHVPTGSVEKYKVTAHWNDFGTIVALKAGDPGYDKIDNTPITFADASVKAICLENWDADGDGNLSMDEASQVRDIGKVFKGKDITSFNELKYFTHIKEIVGSAFYECTNLKSVTIPDGVTTIGLRAFAYCSSLSSVTFGNSVTTIGESAFQYCSGLTSFTLPNSVTTFGRGAFYKCTGLTSVTLPNSLTAIGAAVFQDCTGLTSVNIPNSVKGIGNNAFENCSSLTTVNIPNSVTYIGEHAFRCSGLTSVTIGNSVTSIGWQAFEDCKSLASVIIPSSVKSIDSSAFNWCLSLSSVTLSEGLTSIGARAFDTCPITTITIPSTVQSIGINAFYGCKNLTAVRSKIEEPFAINDNVFQYYDNETKFTSATLYVPRGTKAKYQATGGWKKFTNIIETDFADEHPKGDLTGDELVNGTDMVALVNVIMNGGNNPSADVNGDGLVNGSDMVALVNIIMKYNNARGTVDFARMAGSADVTSASGSTDFSPASADVTIGTEPLQANNDGIRELTITMENPQMPVTMVQMDVTLPEGLMLTIDDDTDMMAGRTTWLTHQLYTAITNNGRNVRLMLASGRNSLIEGTEGGIIRLTLKADGDFRGGDIMLHDMLCTSPDLTEARPADTIVRIESTTGITDNKRETINNNGYAYDLQGRHINPSIKRKGVIIINGKKLIK
ncbi:MAG: leucine-rich repeat protein [Prevotella sp.]|nr:leucine-rich repeat protein [Prevotella sp.]